MAKINPTFDNEFDKNTGKLPPCCYCDNNIAADVFAKTIHQSNIHTYHNLRTLREKIYGARHKTESDTIRHPHQWRISPSTLNKAWMLLLSDGFSDKGHRTLKFSDFEELYDRVWFLLKDIGRLPLGRLSIYDISLRIGINLPKPIIPEVYVYLHRGAMSGALKLFPGSHFHFREPLHPLFSTKLPDIGAIVVEDFLCCVMSHD